jgi:uncharacterized protein DUF3455
MLLRPLRATDWKCLNCRAVKPPGAFACAAFSDVQLSAPKMVAQKLWIYVLLSLSFGMRFAASATEFQGVPLPENTSIVLSVVGEGVQIYESKVNSAGACEWTLKAPEAQLKSLSGEVLGKHYGGPTWSLNDGSHLVGNLPPLKTVNAPDGRNIPWLLVTPKTRSDAGLLSTVDYVARIATSGGVAPEEPPKGPSDTARVEYRATYLFLRKQAR